MASPQTAHGYARIALELLEAISRFPFSGQEARVVTWVLRNSYGWNRKETGPTSVRLIAQATDMWPSSVGWAVQGLAKRAVLHRLPGGALRLNKNYDEWLARGSDLLPLFAGLDFSAPKPKRGAPLAEVPAPSLAQVQAYAQQRQSTVDPERFFHHFEATGWRTGKTKVTNWKAAFCYWERTQFGAKPPPAPKKCPVCEERPLPEPPAIACAACGACCSACGATGRRRLVERPDGTKTVRCAGKCRKDATGLAEAAVPTATRALDAERTKRFMAEHQRRKG